MVSHVVGSLTQRLKTKSEIHCRCGCGAANCPAGLRTQESEASVALPCLCPCTNTPTLHVDLATQQFHGEMLLLIGFPELKDYIRMYMSQIFVFSKTPKYTLRYSKHPAALLYTKPLKSICQPFRCKITGANTR